MPGTVLLVVEGLPSHFTSEDLKQLCQPYGRVMFAKVLENRLDPAQPLIGFVRMETREQGEQVVDHLHGRELSGYTIRVTLLPEEQ
jgi:RNA recognition motif-containing protein